MRISTRGLQLTSLHALCLVSLENEHACLPTHPHACQVVEATRSTPGPGLDLLQHALVTLHASRLGSQPAATAASRLCSPEAAAGMVQALTGWALEHAYLWEDSSVTQPGSAAPVFMTGRRLCACTCVFAGVCCVCMCVCGPGMCVFSRLSRVCVA